MPLRVRNGGAADLPLLEAMLYEAFAWNPEAERPDFEVLRSEPEFQKLLASWGRAGDSAVVAESEGEPLGAAWYRLWTQETHSYGFVDEATPEIAIGVAAAGRSQGTGRALLRALVERAQSRGHPALSLSVDPHNFARRLYESEGFRKVGEEGTSWTLLRRL